MGSEVQYRICEVGEEAIPQLRELAWVIFPHTYRTMLSPEQIDYMMDMMYSMPNLQKQIEEGHHYYIAYDEETSRGYVSVQHEGADNDGIEVFHLHKIYVMPDAQGMGIGIKLFNRAVEHAKEASSGKPARIELNVNKFNKSVGFYKHIGMRVLLEEDFPIGNGFYKTDYIMGLDL